MAAADYFLKLDSIEGESTDFSHKGSIEVLSFSWGLHNGGSALNAGAGRASRPSFEDFRFTAHSSKASPKMFIACAKGTGIKTATFSAAKRKTPEGGSQDFLVIKMENVLISSYSESGTQNGLDDIPGDSVSLSFAQITFTYRPQNADGAPGEPVTERWDLRAGKD